jgi:hypothetical protein
MISTKETKGSASRTPPAHTGDSQPRALHFIQVLLATIALTRLLAQIPLQGHIAVEPEERTR